MEGSGKTYDLDDFGDLLKDAVAESTSSQGFKCPDKTVTGERHTELYKLLRSQKARDIPQDVALVGCHAYNENHVEPPIEKKELDAYLRRVWEQPNDPNFKDTKKGGTFPYTEAGDAEFFAFKHKDDVRYDHALRRFHHFDGTPLASGRTRFYPHARTFRHTRAPTHRA